MSPALLSLGHLENVDNNAEHNVIEWGGKTWYWYNNHMYNNKGVVTQGIFVFIIPAVSMMNGEPKRINSRRVVPKLLW
jgi:hypothetical protein